MAGHDEQRLGARGSLSLGKEAFTLVELLVVVAIILTLAIISVPVSTALTQNARATGCKSNLRQIGIAVHQYIGEHNGMFPPTRTQYQRDPKTGIRVAKPPLYDALEAYIPHVRFTGGGPLDSPGAKASMAGVWWCPGDVDRPASIAPYSYGIVMAIGGGKAAVNTWDDLPNPTYDPRYAYLHTIEKPASQLIYMIDFIKTTSATLTAAVDATAWPMKAGSTRPLPKDGETLRVDFTRHGQSANALFLDGSVRTLKPEALLDTGDQFLEPIR